ncbi:MAG: response regulator [Ferruginibacter sp.]
MNKKNTILIVDDDDSIIKIVSLILANAGYDIITDNNGDLHFLQTNIYPDLILLDNQLGSKSGADICRQLKTNQLTKHIPVMLVSATEGLPEIATYACADDFLPKPFDVDTLLQKVDSLLSNMDIVAAR